MTDPQTSGYLVDAVRLLLTAGAAGGAVKAYESWRVNKRRDRLDPAITVAEAAERVAATASMTVEALIAPLREQMDALASDNTALREELTAARVEIHLMREALTKAGLPIPAPPLRRVQ